MLLESILNLTLQTNAFEIRRVAWPRNVNAIFCFNLPRMGSKYHNAISTEHRLRDAVGHEYYCLPACCPDLQTFALHVSACNFIERAERVANQKYFGYKSHNPSIH